MNIAVLCGGVGAARLLRGLVDVVPPASISAIVNTGDDTELHGLTVCPDLDTVTYTLADAIDSERGWGLAGETWDAMGALERYARVRPDGSTAATTWFNLGDRDLATHLYRTARLREGATLTAVSAEIARAWDIGIGLLPMTDARFRTIVRLAATHEDVSFQDYFVRLRHGVAISDVRFEHDDAQPTEGVLTALGEADVIIVAPSNPIVSIGPIRALSGIDALLAEGRDRVVAVSPIVGGAALKGPADRMLTELGLEPTVEAVAGLYAPIASTLVVDPADATHAAAVEESGVRCVVEPSIMSDPERAAALARACIAAGAG